MANKPIAHYPCKQKQDGAYGSICITCFAIVPIAKSESELIGQDVKHVCHRWTLYERLFDRSLLKKISFVERQ